MTLEEEKRNFIAEVITDGLTPEESAKIRRLFKTSNHDDEHAIMIYIGSLFKKHLEENLEKYYPGYLRLLN